MTSAIFLSISICRISQKLRQTSYNLVAKRNIVKGEYCEMVYLSWYEYPSSPPHVRFKPMNSNIYRNLFTVAFVKYQIVIMTLFCNLQPPSVSTFKRSCTRFFLKYPPGSTSEAAAIFVLVFSLPLSESPWETNDVLSCSPFVHSLTKWKPTMQES